MSALAEEHWYNFKYNGFPVHVEPILVDEDKLLFADYEWVKACLKSPIREIHNYSDIISEFKQMFSHIDRHLNEIVFIKCTNKSCCDEFRSPTVKNILGKSKKLLSRSKNAFFNGHYNTFLQETMKIKSLVIKDSQQQRKINLEVAKYVLITLSNLKLKKIDTKVYSIDVKRKNYL